MWVLPCLCLTTVPQLQIFQVAMPTLSYRSIHKVLVLPDYARLFMCHDHLVPGRDEYAWETTVIEGRNSRQCISTDGCRIARPEFEDAPQEVMNTVAFLELPT